MAASPYNPVANPHVHRSRLSLLGPLVPLGPPGRKVRICTPSFLCHFYARSSYQIPGTPSEYVRGGKKSRTHFPDYNRRRYPCKTGNVIRRRSSVGYLILSALLTRPCAAPLSTSSTLRILVSDYAGSSCAPFR